MNAQTGDAILDRALDFLGQGRWLEFAVLLGVAWLIRSHGKRAAAIMKALPKLVDPEPEPAPEPARMGGDPLADVILRARLADYRREVQAAGDRLVADVEAVLARVKTERDALDDSANLAEIFDHLEKRKGA